MSWTLAVDIGGTFTDFAATEQASGRLVVHKRLTTPDDPARSVLAGIPAVLAKAGIGIEAVGTIVHGTTLVTNAIIERRGARTAMIVTRGFADVLDIARERRYDMYDLRIAYPEPLVPRALRVEADERITADGEVAEPLDVDGLVSRFAALAAERDIGAVAICFLNSHANTAHERAAADAVRRALPEIAVSTSANVFPFMREYERWTTATMNAFTQPMVARYLGRLESGLAGLGFGGRLFIMTSSGGMVTVATARRYPVRLLESGPSAGILFAAHLGRALGRADLTAFDMGGTTAKGTLVRGFTPLKRYELEVARVHEFRMGSGLPAKIPVLDLIEIGAGGGSLASVDERGVIRVGPHSAGADPGPVCYGRGGDRPTLTDANLTLGYLDPAFFLGGEMALEAEGARRVIAEKLGAPLGVDAVRAAWGVHETINEDVARAFRNHASERGCDYRRSTLVAFGGCGPIHALRVARKLHIPQVIFPAAAGVMSAVGMLVSPLAFETLRSERVGLEALDAARFDAVFAALIEEGAAAFAGTGVAREDLHVVRALDMRYRGQGYELEVRLPEAGDGADLLPRLPTLFAQTYEAVFARSFPERPVDIVAWKAEVVGPRPAVAERLVPDAAGETARTSRFLRAFFPEIGDFSDIPVHDRYALEPGHRLTGPALIQEPESTCVIGVGDEVVVDALGNLVATTATAARAAA